MDNTLIQEVNQLHANICAALADPSRMSPMEEDHRG